MQPRFEFINKIADTAIITNHSIQNSIDVEWHNHSEFEFVYIIEGFGNAIIGDKLIDYKPHDFFLIGSKVPHLFKSFTQDKTDERIIIQCSDKVLLSEAFQFIEFQDFNNFISKLHYGIYSTSNSFISRSVREISTAPPPLKLFKLYILLYTIASEANYTTLSSLPFSQDKNTVTRLNKILDYTLHNYTKGITVSDVANHVAMSKSAFCNYFKKQTNKRFSEFINEIRINKACQMLNYSDLSISEISYTIGFSNLSYFNRSFLKQKECTPKEYRIQANKPQTTDLN